MKAFEMSCENKQLSKECTRIFLKGHETLKNVFGT